MTWSPGWVLGEPNLPSQHPTRCGRIPGMVIPDESR